MMRLLYRQKSRQAGFTLIELIIVFAILSIFAVAILTTINPIEQIKKANDGRRKADLYQVQRALETYYHDFGQYPQSNGNYLYINGAQVKWGNPWQPYMNVLPKDPNSAKTYVYYAPSSANGQTYFLYASLDRGDKDPQACNKGAACTNTPAGATCGDVCNFGVSSPNVTP